MHGKSSCVLLMLVIMLAFHGRRLALAAKEVDPAVLEKWTKVKQLYADIADTGLLEGETCDFDPDDKYATKLGNVAGQTPEKLESRYEGQVDDYIAAFDPKNKGKFCAVGKNHWCYVMSKTCKCCETLHGTTCENSVDPVVKDRHPDNQKGLCQKASPASANGNVDTACGPSCRLLLLLALATPATI